MELFKKYFKQVKILGQRIYCNSTIWPVFSRGHSELAEYVIERNPGEFAFVEGDKRIPLYFIALASDADVRESASNLVDISNELLTQKDRAFAAAHATLERQLTAEREVMVQQVADLQATMKSQQQAQAEKDQLMVQQAAELQATMKSQQTHLSQVRQESVPTSRASGS